MKQIIAIFSALMMFAIIQPTAAHTINRNYATATSNVNMRACGSTRCHRIRTIPRRATVRVFSCRRGWCRVRYAHRVGYVSRSYLRIGNQRHRHGRRSPRRGIYFYYQR